MLVSFTMRILWLELETLEAKDIFFILFQVLREWKLV